MAAHSLDGMSQLPRGERAFSLVPANDVPGRISLARKMQRRLEQLLWPGPFIVAPTRGACERAGLPCLFTERCFVDRYLNKGFAAALCAKVFAVATLFQLGADVLVTDSDVAFFGPPPWRNPVFEDLSIVGQVDAVPLNTGMLYFKHARPSADLVVQWILAEWLHRIQTVSRAAGICGGCDQALLNEMVNGMVLCEESALMILGFVLRPKYPAEKAAWQESFDNYTEVWRRAAKAYQPVRGRREWLSTTMTLCDMAKQGQGAVAESLARFHAGAGANYAAPRALSLPTQLYDDRNKTARLAVATQALFMHWAEFEQFWRPDKRRRRPRPNGAAEECTMPAALHLSGLGPHLIRPLVLDVLVPPVPPPAAAYRLLMLSPKHWPAAFLQAQSAFEQFMHRLARAAWVTGWKLAVPIVPRKASWSGARARAQSLVAAGCNRSSPLRWLPSGLAHTCGGRLLDVFRAGASEAGGWQLDVPGRADVGAAIISLHVDEGHKDWEHLLRSQPMRRGTLLIKAVARPFNASAKGVADAAAVGVDCPLTRTYL